jgi:hypothetical protein
MFSGREVGEDGVVVARVRLPGVVPPHYGVGHRMQAPSRVS